MFRAFVLLSLFRHIPGIARVTVVNDAPIHVTMRRLFMVGLGFNMDEVWIRSERRTS